MNLDLMTIINKQFLETPFYRMQQMVWHLQNEAQAVHYKRIRRLMRFMPIYQKRYSLPEITYLPMRTRLLYLLPIPGLFTPEIGSLAYFQHAYGQLLRRGAARGYPSIWSIGDHAHGSGHYVLRLV